MKNFRQIFSRQGHSSVPTTYSGFSGSPCAPGRTYSFSSFAQSASRKGRAPYLVYANPCKCSVCIVVCPRFIVVVVVVVVSLLHINIFLSLQSCLTACCTSFVVYRRHFRSFQSSFVRIVYIICTLAVIVFCCCMSCFFCSVQCCLVWIVCPMRTLRTPIQHRYAIYITLCSCALFSLLLSRQVGFRDYSGVAAWPNRLV